MYSLTVLLKKKKKKKDKDKKLKQNTMFKRKIMSNEMASTLLKRDLEVKYYMSSWQWLPIAQLTAKKKKKFKHKIIRIPFLDLINWRVYK